jgi:dolichyl-phosphate beta-glucosyltransferase
MDLSIVIPAFNEGDKIARDIEAAAQFLTENRLTGEIIVVDDGSTDHTASAAQQTQISDQIPFEVISYPQNLGKGHALRRGIEQTRGDYVLFADSGLCVPYKFALVGMNLIKAGDCDIAHGSRKLPESDIVKTHYVHRHICSRIFRWIVTRFMGIPRNLSDSQCGFKIYRGEIARKLYGECISERFMFDVEIILRATRQGYRICEFPLAWHSDRDTRFRFFRGSFRSLLDLITIKRALKK